MLMNIAPVSGQVHFEVGSVSGNGVAAGWGDIGDRDIRGFSC
jgi:hypothetical protein